MATRLLLERYGVQGRQVADHLGFGTVPRTLRVQTLRVRKWLPSSQRWTQPVVVPLEAVIKMKATNDGLPRGFPGRISDYQWARAHRRGNAV